MTEETVTIALYGLAARNGLVRAEVFARKLGAFVQALRDADKAVNGGKRAFHYLLSEMKASSAVAKIREVQASTRLRPRASGINEVGRITRQVNDGIVSGSEVESAVARRMITVTKGNGKIFSHGEVLFSDTNVVRIDDFLAERCQRAVVARDETAAPSEKFFEGIAYGSIEGVLKAVDLRGTVKLATLIASAGGIQIDCVCNEIAVPTLGENLDRRVTIEGKFAYERSSGIPRRIDIRSIRPLAVDGDIRRWRGAFDIARDDEADW